MLLSLEKKKENCLRHELARFLDKLDLIFQFATIRYDYRFQKLTATNTSLSDYMEW